MHAVWHWILWILAATSADQHMLKIERAEAAGAVAVAYASLATEPAPEPRREEPEIAPPAPPPCPCNGKGYTVRPDGSRWACGCKTCPTGKCPTEVSRGAPAATH